MKYELKIDPIKCDGRGLCAELFPEHVVLDDWGFPIIKEGTIDERLLQHAKRACSACPTSAITIQPKLQAIKR